MNDPYLILGVSETAGDAAIEAAYRAGIRRHSPDRDPEGFQVLRDAYEKIRTRRDRLALTLFDSTPPDAEDLLERLAPAGQRHRPAADILYRLLRGEE